MSATTTDAPAHAVDRWPEARGTVDHPENPILSLVGIQRLLDVGDEKLQELRQGSEDREPLPTARLGHTTVRASRAAVLAWAERNLR